MSPASGDPAAAEALEAAVAALRRGELVGFPTETVYGLGADATNAEAVRRLYAVKQRPTGHPVIAHLGRDCSLDDWAVAVSDEARALAAACWPGPLTLIVRRRRNGIVDEVTGGRPTVGLRVPDHPLALDLLDRFARPVAAPSANRFGRVSPTTAPAVRSEFGDGVAVVLDGGPCAVGVESTIVDCSGARPLLVRLGGVTEERLGAILGVVPARRTDGEVAAPGTLASHYAPDARVVVVEAVALAATLAALPAEVHAGVIAPESLGPVAPETPGAPGSGRWVVLGRPRDAAEYARVLYACLRAADEASLDVVIAVPPDASGIGAAVRDRLARAAAVR